MDPIRDAYNFASSVFPQAQAAIGALQSIRQSYRNMPKLESYKRGKKRRVTLTPSSTYIPSFPRTYVDRPLRYRLRKIAKRVNKMSCKINQGIGELIYRELYTRRITAPVKLQNVTENSLCTTTVAENILSTLEYLDTSTPGALATVPGNSGTFSKKFCFERYRDKHQIRNNGIRPVRVTVYMCRVKADTTTSPANAWSQGIADVYQDPATMNNTHCLSYPTDSDVFTDQWKIHRKVSFVLQPGRQRTLAFALPRFVYDPAIADSHTDVYQKAFGGAAWLYVVEGLPTHDSTAPALISSNAGEIDILAERVVRVTYDAGANIKRYRLVDNQGTVTTQQTANKPEAVVQ